MARAQTIVLSLSGPRSHTIVDDPGRGDLCIGPANSGAPTPDVVVAPDDALNWSTFDSLTVPAGYSWPRLFHYRGNDHGFFAWSGKRRIETFEWTPLTDAVVDARDAVLRNEAIPRSDWQEAVEHGAVGQSLKNLTSFPFVRAAFERGELALNGAWFSIGKGELHWRDEDTGAFTVVAANDPQVDQDNKI